MTDHTDEHVNMLPYKDKKEEREMREREQRRGSDMTVWREDAHFGGAPLYGLGLLVEDMDWLVLR